MSLHEKFTEALYSKSEDDADYEKLADDAASTLDSMDHPFFAQRILVICYVANLIVFGLGAYFHKLIVFELSILLIIILFAIGFFISFALIKLFKIYYQGKKQKPVDKDFIGVYEHFGKKSSEIKFWIIAALGGLLNLAGFFLII